MDASEGNGRPVQETSTQHGRARLIVQQRYHEILIEQQNAPDKVFIDRYTLRDLDQNLVTLDEKAHEHSRMWATSKKARASALYLAYSFLSPFASTSFAPAYPMVMKDLGITNSAVGALTVSIFMFAFAIGPLFLAPLSEMYGRTIIIHIGNFFFAAFSIGAGFAKTPTQFLVLRVLSALGGSATFAVVGGFVADVFDLAARPKASGVVMVGPVLGPVVGPVCGGLLSEEASWRWAVWVPVRNWEDL